MACDTTQTWLLQADSLHPECWPADLAEHVQSCGECSRLARELRQLEDNWRHLPVPAESEQAKAAFVQKLPALRAAVIRPRSRAKPAARWAAAAMVLIAAGSFLWMVGSPGPVGASSEIVDKLIAWNLALSKADPEERKRLLDRGEAAFQDDLRKARLSQEERELAERLFATGRWMVNNDDPLAEAGKWTDIADRLMNRIDLAAETGNLQDAQRDVSRYSKVWEQGVHGCMQRANQKAWRPDLKENGFGEIQRHDESHRQQFQQMMDRARPEMKKFFEPFQKKGRTPFPAPAHGPGHSFPAFKK